MPVIELARYLPRDGYTSMPWRNGVGVTREIARAPALGERFAWRLSLASLQVSGPFSSYPGYQRCVALVDGHGFHLHVAGAEAQKLAVRGAHALFAGAAEARCELLDGPCTDLSLMVLDPGTIDGITRIDVIGEHVLKTVPGKLQVLFVLHGAVACRPVDSSIAAESVAPTFKLNTNDTLLIPGGGHSWSLNRATSATAEVLAISFSSV